jgi:tetratricopeptide (TPR) repeat protein
MTKKPFSFNIALNRFDVNLLPPEARGIGSAMFKEAVVAHFTKQYSEKGETALVTVDDQQISVLTFPGDAAPLDFVLSMLQSGKIKEAIPFLEGLNKAQPKDSQVLYNLGIAYSELGQFDEAIIRLKKVVEIDPSHAHAWTGIGVAYQRMGKPESALAPMKSAVDAAPDDGYAQRNLGALLLGLGNAEDALKHLKIARRTLPHDPQATYGLAAALEAVGGEDNEAEADELYTVVIERWPSSPMAEFSRTARTKLAHKGMRDKVAGGLRPDVMMYIAGALDTLARLGDEKLRQIAFEIAMKGQSGLDINDPEQKYSLKTLPGKFSGMHLVSIMYTAFKHIDPTIDGGIDLQAEYDAAVALRAPQGKGL